MWEQWPWVEDGGAIVGYAYVRVVEAPRIWVKKMVKSEG